MKEFLLKMKLIRLFHNLPTSNISNNFDSYLKELNNVEINEYELKHTTEIIIKSLSCFLENNQDLFKKTLDELKIMIAQKIANQLKKEKEHNHKINQFIDCEEFLFQKEKSLSASL